MKRVRALDAARGLAVAAMVLVNNVGDPEATPAQLLHPAWHGMTFADVVFPAFVLYVGASAAIGRPRGVRVLRRVVLLMVLGLLVNAGLAWPVELGELRWTGVLQRIALVVVVLALVARDRRWFVPAAVGVAALAAHWVVLSTDVLEPAQNASRSLDRALIPVRHLYAGPTDPEGVLGTLSAVATGLLGLIAGRMLLKGERGAAACVLIYGAALGVAGALASAVIPVNKRLWTPSFALLTAGIAIAVLAALAAVEPTRAVRALVPLEVLGRNAIVVYVGSEVLTRPSRDLLWPVVDGVLGGATASVAYAVVVVAIWLAVAAVLAWRRWYIRV